MRYLYICLLFLCRLYSFNLDPWDMILFFLHILVSHNHTKTHTLLFYIIQILINLNSLVYSWILFCIFLANKFSEKQLLNESLVQILNNFFLLQLLQVWHLYVFFHIFYGFSKNCIVHQLEKVFFKITFYFFLSSVSYQFMVLTKNFYWAFLLTICTFLNNIPGLDVYYKFFMCKDILFCYTSRLKVCKLFNFNPFL